MGWKEFKGSLTFHCRIQWYAELNKNVFSFFLKSLVSVISLMSTNWPFHALGAATENISHIQSHPLSNSLSSSFQSAYHMFHSTETTLLSIHNDVILAMDRDEVFSLILHDLSVAFDIIDHSILLHHLQNWFGLHDTSVDWFSSYLTFSGSLHQNSTSYVSNLSCGVPKGSVLGPLLCTTPLGSVISKNSIKYYLYADDTQLYISFTPSNSTSSL